MAAYLAEYAPGFPIQSLADVIAWNEKHRSKAMPWFGQEHFVMAQARGGLDSPEYLQAREEIRRLAREGIDGALREHDLDALVGPTANPAWLTDFIRGDNSGGGFTSPAAVAGYPHVTVPAGFVHGLPCGLSFVGTAWSEPRLIALAYAFEQATRLRRAPTYPPTVNTWKAK
jgi:amidase